MTTNGNLRKGLQWSWGEGNVCVLSPCSHSILGSHHGTDVRGRAAWCPRSERVLCGSEAVSPEVRMPAGQAAWSRNTPDTGEVFTTSGAEAKVVGVWYNKLECVYKIMIPLRGRPSSTKYMAWERKGGFCYVSKQEENGGKFYVNYHRSAQDFRNKFNRSISSLHWKLQNIDCWEKLKI